MSKTCKRGRKTKLNKEIIDVICKNIRIGATYAEAAQLAGIAESTFYSWKNKGIRCPATRDW